eukprot:3940489-Rhodomonas_salina.1
MQGPWGLGSRSLGSRVKGVGSGLQPKVPNCFSRLGSQGLLASGVTRASCVWGHKGFDTGGLTAARTLSLAFSVYSGFNGRTKLTNQTEEPTRPSG